MIKWNNLSSTVAMGVCVFVLQAMAFTVSAQIQASQSNGKLSFAGKHAGMSFDGEFTTWQATLELPPSESPNIQASFDLSSAKTGDSTYDSTLPEGDWFDVENHPTAKFVADDIQVKDEGYLVSGELTLRGKSLPIDFVLNSSADKLTAAFTVDRIAYGIGLDSDPDAEWVSRNIEMALEIDL